MTLSTLELKVPPFALALIFVLPMFQMYLNRFQIRPEERVLSARFGSAYVNYAQSVRRWL